MVAWVVRGGGREDEALEDGMLIIGFGVAEDLGDVTTKQDMDGRIRQWDPHSSAAQISNKSGQIWSFRAIIQVGDLAVMPRKGLPTIAVGEVTREYEYRPGLDMTICRPVKWLNKEIPRDSLEQDLRVSMMGNATVYRPRAVDAETRLRAIAEARSLPVTRPEASYDEELEPPFDVEEYARDLIREHVEKNFHGHDLADLVGAVLKAQGYTVDVATPGPDGGVDILAGRGPMGFDRPRICAQVKSGKQTVGTNVLRELQGVMHTFQADHGLLVSWGGFARQAQSEARSRYFNVRLWNADDLLRALMESYDQLSSDVKTRLPLKRVWTLIPDGLG